MLRSAYSMAASTAASAADVLQLEAEVALLRAAGYAYSQAPSQAASQAPSHAASQAASRRPSSDSVTAEAAPTSAPSDALHAYAPTSAPDYAETAPLDPPPEVRKFKSGAEAAAAALAAARAGAAPLVSAPGSEVSLLPIKYKSGREAALAALAEAQRRRGETPTTAPAEAPVTATAEAPITAPAEEPPSLV